jgi:Tfp pilus assembly protein PilF
VSNRRKSQRPTSGPVGRKTSSFPIVPVIVIAIGTGLFLSFSGTFARKDASAPGAITPPPAPPATNPRPTATVAAIDAAPPMSDGDRSAELINTGTELFQNGNYLEAATNYAAAVQLTPEDETARFNLASALSRLGKLEEAKAEYLEALKLFPDYPEAHNNLGNVLASQGNLTEAAEHLSTAVKLSPESANSHNSLGTVLIRLGKINEAAERFTEATRLVPDHLEARCNLGNTFIQLGKLNEAADQFEAVLRTNPDFEPAKRGLARVTQARQAPPLVPNSPVPLP